MNQAAQAIAPDNVSRGGDTSVRKFLRYQLSKALVWSSSLVVINKLAQHMVEVVPTKYQEVIQRFPTQRSAKAFARGAR